MHLFNQAVAATGSNRDQRRIVAYLDGLAGQVAALAQLQSETSAALDALLPSMLDKPFKGEL
jgi:type I restriction enzyme, S subunit